MTDPNRFNEVPPTTPEPPPPTATNPNVEEFRVSADNLMSKVQEIIREGNARRILIKNASGDTLLAIPQESCVSNLRLKRR